MHYRRLGYRLLDRNWRSPLRELPGELDIVAVIDRPDGPLIAFCEVKTRRSAGYGGAAAAVDAVKQQRVRQLAAAWLRSRGVGDAAVRFDVIAVEGARLTLYEAAF